MADNGNPSTQAPANMAEQHVQELARMALERLMGPKDGPSTRSIGLADRLDDLCEAFLSDNNDARHRIIHQMRQDGIGVAKIIDHVVPAVATVLGQRWVDDTLSFVDVTIGTARLQEVVRSLVAHELSWNAKGIGTARQIARADGSQIPRILLVVPGPEDHTLGVFVAADQFRRFGYHVEVAISRHPKQLAATLYKQKFCLIGISVAGRRTLASVRELVDIIRTTVTHVTPIVLGGSLVQTDQELKTTTGVDYVVGTVRGALEVCGLDILELDPPVDLVANR